MRKKYPAMKPEKVYVVNDYSFQPQGSSYKLNYSGNSSNKILQRFTECTVEHYMFEEGEISGG